MQIESSTKAIPIPLAKAAPNREYATKLKSVDKDSSIN